MAIKYVMSTDALSNTLYKLKIIRLNSVKYQLAFIKLEMVRMGVFVEHS